MNEEITVVKYTVRAANYHETLPANYRTFHFPDKDRAIEYMRVIIERFDFVELLKVKEQYTKKP